MFPTLKITEKDIESSWAGVRPLIWKEGKDPSEISRKDEIWESDSGLLSIAGGKLTGYRKMAEMIVNVLVQKFQDEYNQLFGECKTSQFPISGGEVGGSNGFKAFIKEAANEGVSVGISDEEALHLVSSYGSNVTVLFDLMEKEKRLANLSNLPIIFWAKLHYALEYEMVATPIDFFNRRISAMLFDIDAVRRFKTDVINYMADYFQWSENEKRILTPPTRIRNRGSHYLQPWSKVFFLSTLFLKILSLLICIKWIVLNHIYQIIDKSVGVSYYSKRHISSI